MSPFVTKTFTTFKEAESYIAGINVVLGFIPNPFDSPNIIIGNIEPLSPKGYSVTVSRY
jgi:hypothetical protein